MKTRKKPCLTSVRADMDQPSSSLFRETDRFMASLEEEDICQACAATFMIELGLKLLQTAEADPQAKREIVTALVRQYLPRQQVGKTLH